MAHGTALAPEQPSRPVRRRDPPGFAASSSVPRMPSLSGPGWSGPRQALRHPGGSPLAFMGVEELQGRPTSSCRTPLGPQAARRPRTAPPRPAHRRPARGEIPACRRWTYRHGAGPSASGPRTRETCGWAAPIGAAGPPRLRGGRRGRPPGLATPAPALMRNRRRPKRTRLRAPRARPRQSGSHASGRLPPVRKSFTGRAAAPTSGSCSWFSIAMAPHRQAAWARAPRHHRSLSRPLHVCDTLPSSLETLPTHPRPCGA